LSKDIRKRETTRKEFNNSGPNHPLQTLIDQIDEKFKLHFQRAFVHISAVLSKLKLKVPVVK
jgi:hypothetical protein